MGSSTTPTPPKIAIVGSGPTGLMAATRLTERTGLSVDLFERRAGFGRKLLVAGSSGLNISHRMALDEFAKQYVGKDARFWRKLLADYGPDEWVGFIERELGLETFVGTSRRYFVREMKASRLLSAWRAYLEARGVRFHPNAEFVEFGEAKTGWELRFGDDVFTADRVLFALGGGSWEKTPPAWPEIFRARGLTVEPFTPANVGYSVAWNPRFLAEAEGKPFKKIRFGNRRGEKDGELVVTAYGLEGTPIYSLGEPGPAWIDLKPDLNEAAILARLEAVRENLAPLRRVKAKLELCDASLALLFHHSTPAERADLRGITARIKRFPITLGEPRPLEEAISSRGGLALTDVDDSLAIRRLPGAYAGGEMLAWHAPTGGFLIQAAVSMGDRMARSVLAHLDAQSGTPRP